MTTAILPDDSVVIRLARETIHLCAKTRSIHIRAAHPRKELGGSMLASYPLAAAERVRLERSSGDRVWLVLDLRSGQTIGLGDAPSQDVGMLTARMIADLTRCKLEVAAGEVSLIPDIPAVPPARSIDEETRRIHWEDDTVPPLLGEPLHDGTIEAPRAFDPSEVPVFMDLLRESEFLAPASPLERPATPVGDERRRPPSSVQRLRAVFQMLRLTAEALPEARVSLCDAVLPHPRPST
jgi:hypothetical protein